jgi:hypothetical protein
VYDYYYNGVEDRYSIDVFLCLKFPKQQTKIRKKGKIPHTKASGRDETKRYGTSHTPVRHRLLPRNNNTTSHQQQQPAPRDNNLLKCKGKMDMMGKFLTRSNRSKTQEKEEDEDEDAWDFISSYRPYNFLFVLMFKIVVVVVVVGIPLESVAPPSTSLCKFVPSIRTGTSQNVLSFWTPKN